VGYGAAQRDLLALGGACGDDPLHVRVVQHGPQAERRAAESSSGRGRYCERIDQGRFTFKFSREFPAGGAERDPGGA